MKGSLTKIQSLLRNSMPDNKELGIKLLEAYCYSLNYAPTLLHVLKKGRQYITPSKRLRILDRILKETSKRMFDILDRHVLGEYLCPTVGNKPQCVRSSYYHIMWEPDNRGRQREWRNNRLPYSPKAILRYQRENLHRYITEPDFDKRMQIREIYIPVVMRQIINRRVRSMVENYYSKHEKPVQAI